MKMRKKSKRPAARAAFKKRLLDSKRQRNRVHVVPQNKKWAVKKEGSQRASRVFVSRETAIKKAQSMIQTEIASEVIIHKKDGTVDSRQKSSGGEE